MLPEVREFIQQNHDLINSNDWDAVYNKLTAQYTTNSNVKLKLPISINLTKILLGCRIDLGFDYDIDDFNRDVDLLKSLTAEHFTDYHEEDTSLVYFLFDEAYAKALTNILRVSRIISKNDFIPGDGNQNSLSYYIAEVYDQEVKQDIASHNYGSYEFYLGVELHSISGKYLGHWENEDNPFYFHLSGYSYSDEYSLKEDDLCFKNQDKVIQDWVEEILSLNN